MPAMTDHLRGTFMMVFGVLVLSPDTLLIYLVDADSWTIVFWRGVLVALTIFAAMTVHYRRDVIRRFTDIGRGGMISAALFGITSITFVTSVTLTTAANTLVIVASAPLFAAVFSRIFLKELVPIRTWAAAVVGFFAMVIIFSGSLGGGALAGDILALVTTICLAANFIVIRVHKEVSMVPAAALGGLICALAALPFASPASIHMGDILPIIIMGTIVLPFPLVMITVAPKLIPAPEVGLIMLLETALGPLWVWLVVGQRASVETLVGGGIILATLVVHNILAFRQGSNANFQDPRS
jgi:drug/metabolite transporter (DMT)-like permease